MGTATARAVATAGEREEGRERLEGEMSGGKAKLTAAAAAAAAGVEWTVDARVVMEATAGMWGAATATPATVSMWRGESGR